MKMIWNFLSRDIVNSFVFVLTIILGAVSIITGDEIGYLYVLLAVFIFRMMLVHYWLWDSVNDNVTDNMIRISVFGLPPLNSLKLARHGVLYTVVNMIIFLAGVVFLIFFTLSLLK